MDRPPGRRRSRRWRWPASTLGRVLGALIAVALAVTALSEWGGGLPYRQEAVGALVFLAATAVVVPVAGSLETRTGVEGLRRILLAGWILQFAAMVARIYVLRVQYGDVGDYNDFYVGGLQNYQSLRGGRLGIQGAFLSEFPPGTQRTAYVVAVVFLLTGVSQYAASVVFGCVAFAGKVLGLLALRNGVPGSDLRRYALLVFLLPALAFWPSVMSKEALIFGGLGAFAFGASMVLVGRRVMWGVLLCALSGLGMFLIRPNVAVTAVVALWVGQLVRLRPSAYPTPSSTRRSAVLGVVLGAVVAGVAWASIRSTSTIGVVWQDLPMTLSNLADRSTAGGSQFVPAGLWPVWHVPEAVVTVLLRPFPWEATSWTSMVAGIEGVVILILAVGSRHRIAAWAREVWRVPYLMFAAAISALLIGQLAYIGNFGTLARHRSLLLLFVLVPLCMQGRSRSTATDADGDPALGADLRR